MQEVATGYGLIEAPVWEPARGLYFSDVLNGGISLLDRRDQVSVVLERRRGVGGMALHAAGGIVFGGRDVSWSPLGGGEGKVLLTSDAAGGIGFNDLTTDAAGRIYVGSLAFRVFGGDEPKPGHLHVIDLDGTMRTVSDGVMLTNGLGFSPDGRRLYHSDSRSGLVRVYDVAADGSVGPWRKLADFAGVADGLKVAADGSIWVADARGGRVVVLEPDGAHRMDLAVPLPMVTSLCFGGDDLKDLYVVTGSEGGPRETCGTIFRTRTELAGQPLNPARVAL
ncbi:MAG TPA: SMP-30/gluconolactonase/LRE family protein [Caulobacteraceae bacterium]|nr:SMP-30/gluconolactonase/LRE family protein [Caulobacteraceae bacterium]